MSIKTSPPSNGGGYAVVIGRSMGGLLAARALSDYFERVTIVEWDRFPEGVEDRKGVPQGRHAHGLLPRGHMIMERLFPGLSGELVSRGAIIVDAPAESLRYQPGRNRVRFATGKTGLFMSRPLLEGQIRRRVSALANVTVLEEHAVTGLLSGEAGEAGGRASGVTMKRRVEGASERRLAADLVVDAGGRGSRAPGWLEEMGYERPPEERIEIGVGYTTCLYRRRPDDLSGVKFVIIEPTPGRERRMGAMFRIEGERWMVTLGGWLGERSPTHEEGFVEFARGLPAPDIHSVIKDAEALGEAVKYNFPANLRRRYERLRRLPEGYLVTGDALCSFNPIYGQGMSVAALETEALEDCLREGRDDLPRRFYRRVSKVIDTPWKLAAGAGAINWYLGQVQRTEITLPDGRTLDLEATPATGVAGLYDVRVSDGHLSGASDSGGRLEGEVADGPREDGSYLIPGTVTAPDGRMRDFEAVTSTADHIEGRFKGAKKGGAGFTDENVSF